MFHSKQNSNLSWRQAVRNAMLVAGMITLVPGLAMPAMAQSPYNATLAKDTWVWYENQGTNYGTQLTLDVKIPSNLERRTYLEFTLPAASTVPAITSATLQLVGGYASGDSSTINMYWLSSGSPSTDFSSWNQSNPGGLTWGNQPSTDIGTTAVASASVGTSGTYTWTSSNLTSLVKQLMQANPNGGPIDLVLEAQSSTTSAATFSSNSGSNPPQLQLVVPVPGTPTGLTATGVSPTEIDLNWTPVSPAGTGYNIYASTTQGFTPGSGNLIASNWNGTLPYKNNTGLTAGVTYYYRVEAVSTGSLASAFTPEEHGTTFTSLQPGVAILVDSNASSQVLTAVADMQANLLSVLGMSSAQTTSETNYTNVPIIVVTTTGNGSFYSSGISATEEHTLSTVTAQAGTNVPQRMVLQGADIRGTIYAIYEFTKDYLGVPPLYHWTGWTPTLMSSVTVPDNLLTTFTSPAVKYRGVFPDDTDLIMPWGLQTPGSTNYNYFFETLLRLKMNFMDVGHINGFPVNQNKQFQYNVNYQWALTCGDRGLMVTFTHTSPFGADFADWDSYWEAPTSVGGGGYTSSTVPTATITNQTNLDQFWNYWINTFDASLINAGVTLIQTLSFRGAGDEPWWEYMTADDPKTDVLRAGWISTEVNHQLGLLNSKYGTTNPLVRTFFYNESQGFLYDQETQTDGFNSTTFTPPTVSSTDGANLIWMFANTQRDHYPGLDLQNFSKTSQPAQFTGYYDNFEFSSTGSHLTSNEGPWKMEANQSYVGSQSPSGKYVMSMLNIGNFRENALETQAAADLLWFGDGSTVYPSTASYLTNTFVPLYFPSGNATTIEGLYKQYYGDQWQQSPNTVYFGPYNSSNPFPNEIIFQDLRYYQAAITLLNNLKNGCYATSGANCAYPAAVDSPDPFQDTPPDHIDYFEIAPSGTQNAIQELASGATTAAANFLTTYTQCSSQSLPAAQQSYLVDSLCSNAQMMEYLNDFVADLANADENIPNGNNSVLTSLKNAQTDLNSFVQALEARQTGTAFPYWYYDPVTSVAVSGTAGNYTVTVVGPNNLTSGSEVVLTGLTTTAGSYLNGQVLNNITASSTQYTATLPSTYTYHTFSAVNDPGVTMLSNATFSIANLQSKLTALLAQY